MPTCRHGCAAMTGGLGGCGGAVRAAIKAAPTRGAAAGGDDGGPGLAGCGHSALRTRSMVRRRGGLHGRPGRLPIPTALPPNLVGRHAHMPPWPGRDDRGPWWFRQPATAGCGHPALRTRSMVRRRGGLHGRPGRPAIRAALPPNLVGRHAHMPPWLGCDDQGSWWLRGCGPGGHKGRPYERSGGGRR